MEVDTSIAIQEVSSINKTENIDVDEVRVSKRPAYLDTLTSSRQVLRHIPRHLVRGFASTAATIARRGRAAGSSPLGAPLLPASIPSMAVAASRPEHCTSCTFSAEEQQRLLRNGECDSGSHCLV
ncbi:hypothetical protein Scep_004518 [Stephania cephalantha]|uniref:Uncharacterized protein n=1 Tax=Stephania cephalantha TaxID=152367 RepID=A0AAP0PXD4_9MAGN